MTPERRACFLLGLDPDAASAFVRGVDVPGAETCPALVDSPLRVSPLTLARHRANPNRVSCHAWRALVGDRADAVVRARPFFSIEEVAAAAQVPAGTLADLVGFEAWTFEDRPRGMTVALEPVPGAFVVELGESESQVPAALSAAPIPGSGTLRLVTASDFESSGEDVAALKLHHRGRLMPVVEDGENKTRYLAPGRLVVGFAPGFDGTDALAQAGVRRIGTFAAGTVVLAEVVRERDAVDPLRAVLRALASLNAAPGVRYAEPDQLGPADWDTRLDIPPSDFESVQRYWNHDTIGLADAHARTRGDAGVTVFVVDSGLEVSHPQLAPALWEGWSGLDLSFDLDEPESVRSPGGTIAHGTQVAGVVAGQGVGDQPVYGVAPDCRILPAKVSGHAGGVNSPGWGLRAAAIASLVASLGEGDRAVLNISWRTSALSIAIREALADAAARDVVVVMSAGNYPPGVRQVPDAVHYPSFHADSRRTSTGGNARLQHLAACSLSVGAVGPGYRKASYSYFGRHSVDVFAPGGEIGAEGRGVFTTSLGGGAGYTAGTSFACPHVAGLAALLRSADPTLSAPAVVAKIRASAASLDAANPGYEGLLGQGCIDARAAFASLPAAVPPPPEDARLDINVATRQAFEALPLVGAYRARAFVEYREQHGRYRSVYELLRTGVIDTWSLGQLLDRVFVREGLA